MDPFVGVIIAALIAILAILVAIWLEISDQRPPDD